MCVCYHCNLCTILHSLFSGLLVEMGVDYRPIRLDHPVESFVKIFTFNANRKSMSTVIRDGSGYRLLTKGASEIVLRRCSHILQSDGQVRILHVHC